MCSYHRIVIGIILVCSSYATILPNTGVSPGVSDRPIPAHNQLFSVVPKTLDNKPNLQKAASPENQPEEIKNIFSDNFQQVSIKPDMPIDGTVGPGLMEGGGGGNSRLTATETNDKYRISTPVAVSSSTETTVINVGIPHNNSGHHTVGRTEAVLETEKVNIPIKDKSNATLSVNSIDDDVKLSKIHARKGAENKKINARKGVDVNTTIARKGVVLDDDQTNKTGVLFVSSPELVSNSTSVITPIMETISTKSVLGITSLNISVHQPNISTISLPISTTRIPQQTQQSQTNHTKDFSTNLSGNKTIYNSTSKDESSSSETSGIIAAYPPLKKKPKPKPLLTTDKSSFVDTPSFNERTPSQHDYVIPIVVAILAIPMLIVLLLYLYKKGTESWERRHYRRMDFLIDGMYND